MTKRRKTVLTTLAAIVVVLGTAVGLLYRSAFGGRIPIHDGPGPRPGMQTVAMGFVSAFMLDTGPGQVALVDTGTASGSERIVAALRARGLGPDAVQAIFLTHYHGDHIGGLSRFPHADVYALATERDAVIHDGGRVTHALADGETATVGSLSVRAFAVPGHTPGSAAYLANGALFLGDEASASTEGSVLGPVRAFSKNPSQGIASLHALAHRLETQGDSVQVLAFAHSGPIESDCLRRLAAVE